MKRLTLNGLTITNNRLFVNALFSTVLFFLLFSPLHGSGSQPADVVFNEIAWMGTKASANKEWIELYNDTNAPINLEGWKIVAEDGVPKINLTGQIVAQGFYLLERTRDDSLPGVIAQQIYTGALENNGENLRLFDEKGHLMDEIRGENGWPGGDNSTKQTLAREGSSWSTSAAVEGSPGEKNKALVPTETPKLKSAAVNAESPVLVMAALPNRVREVKSEGFSFLDVLGLALLIAALSGIAILIASRRLDIS